MAQKGMSLNPGADPTLVAAAYRAGMANVPKDLSGTFEALAASYDKTMESVAASWSSVIKDVATLGGAAVATAIKNMNTTSAAFTHVVDREEGPLTEEESAKSGEVGWSVTTTTTDDPTSRQKAREESSLKTFTLGDELVNIRKKLRELWGKTDKASRIERNKLKSSRSKLFSELEFLENVDNFNNENLANGLIDEGATGKLPLLMQNALSAYKTKSGKILEGKWAGYRVSLTRDGNDDLNFILKDSQGRIVTGMGIDGEILTERGGKPYSISTKKMQGLLIRKYDETKLKAWNKFMDGPLKSDTKIFGYDGFANKVRAYVQTEEELHGLIGLNPGASKSNLVDEINFGGTAAAELFGGISSAALKGMGVVDADGDGHIGDNPNTKDVVETGDFIGKDGSTNIKNYKIVKDALLNRDSDNYDFKTTQSIFVKYATDAASDMHKFVPAVNKNKNNNKSGGSTNPAWNNQWKSFEDQDRKLQTAMTGGDIRDWGNFLWKSADGGKTYSAEGSDKPEHNNINVVDLLGGHQFGLSNRPLYANLQKKTVFDKDNSEIENDAGDVFGDDAGIVEIQNEQVAKVNWYAGKKEVRKNANGQWEYNTGLSSNPKWEIASGKMLRRIKENYK